MVDGMCDHLTAKDFGTEDIEGELEKLLGSLAFSDDERDLEVAVWPENCISGEPQ